MLFRLLLFYCIVFVNYKMCFKFFVFLTLLSVSFGSPLGSNLNDLHEFMDNVDSDIDEFTERVISVYREEEITMRSMIAETQDNFLKNLNESAEPYFSYIQALNQSAEEQGQNISSCIELGNEELDSLMINYTSTISSEIDDFATNSTLILLNYFEYAYHKPREQRNEMWEKVNDCHHNSCALILLAELMEEYDELKVQMISAYSSALHYFNVEFPIGLSQFTFDSVAFNASLNAIIQDVNNCTESA
ncbi:uncharacterized protein LOC115874622 [Sitophilus oryzae]|uniref:Uncharacterized protein LOC115874622 n=1 Tax=Sitophilus oryzae TaxID=7048 RepID=A0A6J2X385_SITOR|nr:uncharacterized protein LOC115874622 [Sitophilus oryzae]